MIQNELPRVPAPGVGALRHYVSESRSRVDELAPDSLLLLRSAESLLWGLEWVLETGTSLSAAMFSAADVWALGDLAKAASGHSEQFAALGADLAGVLGMGGSSTGSPV
ncbi:MAG TPA: hypothetical protein VII52_10085 [Gemmatimonadaceae bacterium]